MSQNFELLTQLEREPSASNECHTNDAACANARPVVLRGVTYNGQDEMLQLVQRVFLSTETSAPRQVVFCGVDEKDGGSSVCARAAGTLAAHTLRSVCLIDANFRSPRLFKALGVTAMAPIAENSASPHELCTQIGSNLWLAGPGMLANDRGALITSEELERRMALLRIEFDYVLINAPATGVFGDAGQLGRFADAAILVIEAHRTRRLTARKAKESLDASGVRLLGAVLYNRSFPIPGMIYKRL